MSPQGVSIAPYLLARDRLTASMLRALVAPLALRPLSPALASWQTTARRTLAAKRRRFGVDPKHQEAILRNMATALIKHERIRTITTRAKELRRLVERMVTLAKKAHGATDERDVLRRRQQAAAVIYEYDVLRKLFEELGPRYRDRPGGYTRVLKLARARPGDAADMSIIEFVDREGELRRARRVPGGGGAPDALLEPALAFDAGAAAPSIDDAAAGKS